MVLHKLSQHSPRFSLQMLMFEMLYQKLGIVFHQNIQTLRSLLKTSASPRFSTNFLVFGYSDETLFFVFDILRLISIFIE